MELYDLINGTTIQGNIRIVSFDDSLDKEKIVFEIERTDTFFCYDLPENFNEYVGVEYIYSQDNWLIIEVADNWKILADDEE